ncbi:hypothetical protein BDB01DRAFT_833485 [Pilobolus umbonatus]|nr:hypothetical protein BDB01DRAFT_833485 [Pilobolus umbonatus]
MGITLISANGINLMIPGDQENPWALCDEYLSKIDKSVTENSNGNSSNKIMEISERHKKENQDQTMKKNAKVYSFDTQMIILWMSSQLRARGVMIPGKYNNDYYVHLMNRSMDDQFLHFYFMIHSSLTIWTRLLHTSVGGTSNQVLQIRLKWFFSCLKRTDDDIH